MVQIPSGPPRVFKFTETSTLKIYLVIFLSGVVISSLGWVVFGQKKDAAPVPESSLTKVMGDSSELQEGLKPSSANLTVDVSGAVNKPGVFKLPDGSRINDALQAAGGVASESASKKYLAQNLNLAQVIVDGQKIYIPFEGEETPVVTTTLGATSAGQISINNATSSELDTLPGIGPATASKIISGRPYKSIEELLTKKIVGQSVYEQIKGKVGL